MNCFFDNYKNFYGDDDILRKRLNNRHEALIKANRPLLSNKNILDIACNNGRWSFAALMDNAKSVTCVDARYKYIQEAQNNFEYYHVDNARYEFINKDIFSYLPTIKPGRFDTIFIFGFLYHTIQYDKLFSELQRIMPENLIIDTKINVSEKAIIELKYDDTTNPMNAFMDTVYENIYMLVGYPSAKALEMLLHEYGFIDIEYYDWCEHLKNNPDREEINQLRLYNRGITESGVWGILKKAAYPAEIGFFEKD